ncbi:MAG: rhodanese-like domain-containing protein [Vibrio sp.]|uniref:rhodanese-like domain-containing protein n=1 Tax=Vibrio TaxID=662 RepID=UPI001EBD753B|nr:rhodanese-like domain-containing protein [Vibrio sp.]NRB69419.1 rhodanese-like domain-containing protein [Vibrio sp.]
MLLRLSILMLVSMSFTALSTDFPYRSSYSDVKTIELVDLKQNKDTLNIVDVRSTLEYNVLHIDGAKHITIANKGFEAKIKELSTDGKTIAFYCNGITCKKSYKAAQRAMRVGVNNVVAYDAGIFLWASDYPSDSILLGKPMQNSSQLISDEDFKAHILSAKQFEDMLNEPNVVIIDARDPNQRKIQLFKGLPVRSVPVERFETFLNQIDTSTKIMVFDAVGKQVRWLQYILKRQNYTNYHFLKGGVEGYMKSQ